MANGSGNPRMVDGQLSFEGGIDSGRVPTMVSPGFETGLKRNQLAWMTNATVRTGGVQQRTGWKPLVRDVPWPGIFQGAFMYETGFGDPYIVTSIGGILYRIRVDTDNSVENLTAAFPGTTMPPTQPETFFEQGERFLIIQAGDLTTLPLFWDGNLLRRSVGFLGIGNPGNELPAAGPMDYYMGRLWYAFGRQYAAGDIVGSKVSGSLPYNFFDSILKNTENPVSLAGDAFIVPTNAGNIRAMEHSANLNTALGQGTLYVFTRKSVYATDVPPTRTEWANLKEPLQRVAQIDFGAVGQRCVVPVNGDLFYQSVDGIRSLALAIRYFNQWANVAISTPEARLLQFNDLALLRFASGINFDNRLWQTAVPFNTDKGVAHQAIIPLDFDILSNFGEQPPPAFEGMYEGLDILQLLTGDFGGRQRAFAFVVSKLTGNIDLWEFTTQDRFDSQVNGNGDRVTWFLETPAYTWGDPFKLKKLDGLELWFDKMLGTVQFMVEYKVDQTPCWIQWHAWKQCVAKDCREDPEAVSCPAYPVQPYCEGYRATVNLPSPPQICEPNNARPSTEGYQFQIRITVKGWCRLRGLRVYAFPKLQEPYKNMVCATMSSPFFDGPAPAPTPPPTPPVPPTPPEVISWTPDTVIAYWEDNLANFFTGDLATFLATADLNDMGVFTKSSLDPNKWTAITGLSLMVDTESISLFDNSLTAVPALPTTGNLISFNCATNQITSITNFPSSLTSIAVGDNPGLAAMPSIPPLVLFLQISLTGFSAAQVNSILGQLVTNGLNNGTVELVGMDLSASAANIATLLGRGWTTVT
jgi:hypothetical protein